MNPENPRLVYVPTSDLLDYLLENDVTPELVFKWALTQTQISQDFLYEFFAGCRDDGKTRLNSNVPINFQLGPYTQGFIKWAQSHGTEYGKLVPVGGDQ